MFPSADIDIDQTAAYLNQSSSLLSSPSDFFYHMMSLILLCSYASLSWCFDTVAGWMPSHPMLQSDKLMQAARIFVIFIACCVAISCVSTVLLGTGFVQYWFLYLLALPPAPVTLPVHFDYSGHLPSSLLQQHYSAHGDIPSHRLPAPHAALLADRGPLAVLAAGPRAVMPLTPLDNRLFARALESTASPFASSTGLPPSLAPAPPASSPHSRAPASGLLAAAAAHDLLLTITVPARPYFSAPPAAPQLHAASVLSVHSRVLVHDPDRDAFAPLTSSAWSFAPFAPVHTHTARTHAPAAARVVAPVDEMVLDCAARGCHDDAHERPSALSRLLAWGISLGLALPPVRLAWAAAEAIGSLWALAVMPWQLLRAAAAWLLEFLGVEAALRTHTLPLFVSLPSVADPALLEVVLVGPGTYDLNVVDARVSVVARLSALQTLMHEWPIASCIVGTILCAISQAILIISVVGFLYLKRQRRLEAAEAELPSSMSGYTDTIDHDAVPYAAYHGYDHMSGMVPSEPSLSSSDSPSITSDSRPLLSMGSLILDAPTECRQRFWDRMQLLAPSFDFSNKEKVE
jgi:hypothetical protein